MVLVGAVLSVQAGAAEPNETSPIPSRAAVITCTGMIDDGLYQSIKRRTSEAIAQGANVIILEISTYGGLVKSADDISKYLIFQVAPKAHTVAYVKTEAISAGSMISVSCQDIIMREHTTIGDCAPISMGGGNLEGVEREKIESFVRAIFDRAAQANGYPRALLQAMVSQQIEVYRIRNRVTGRDEFFEGDHLPQDANTYDLKGKECVDTKDHLLTVDATKAKEYGIARAVVKNLNGALAFLAQRDHRVFTAPPLQLGMNWSEQMVRVLNRPSVMGILVMVALVGLYMELSTPGLGLPGLVTAICFIIIIGSKYLYGLANWVEIAVLILGIILLLLELLVIPGFGLAGFAGLVCILLGLLGMLVRNPPDQWPWPHSDVDWALFQQGLSGLALGFVGFIVVALVMARTLPKLKVFSGLILNPTVGRSEPLDRAATEGIALQVGQQGEVVTTLRPAGKVRFGVRLVDCVAQAEFLKPGCPVEVAQIHGNRVVVRRPQGEAT